MRSKIIAFTLIEILVVIFIIGIMIGLVTLSLGDFGVGKRIQIAANTFEEYMVLLEDIAIIESTMYSIRIEKEGCSTYRWRNNQWQLLPSPGIFKKKSFPTQAVARLITSSKNKEIIIQSDGSITPFTLNFSNKNALVTQVIGQKSGQVQTIQVPKEGIAITHIHNGS